MAEKSPINARLSTELVNMAKREAQARGMTLTDFLEKLLSSYQTKTGPAAANRKIKKLEAIIAEQERLVQKHTGHGTPEKRRITISLPIEDIQELEGRARRAGMTRPEYVRACLVDRPAARTLAATKTPALPV